MAKKYRRFRLREYRQLWEIQYKTFFGWKNLDNRVFTHMEEAVRAFDELIERETRLRYSKEKILKEAKI